MLHFTCPSCKEPLQAADDFAAKRVTCKKCLAVTEAPKRSDSAIAPGPGPASAEETAVTTPEVAEAAQRTRANLHSNTVPYVSIQRDGGAPMSAARICLNTLIGCSVLVVLACLLLPATRRVREAPVRVTSTNNLKNIGLAFHSFHDINKRLPFNGTGKAIGNDPTSGSWAFQILPYLDQQPAFAAAEAPAAFQVLMCPGRSRPTNVCWSDYFLNNYINDPTRAAIPNNPDMKRTLVEIKDGSSNTIIVGQGSIATADYTSTNNVTLSCSIFMGGTTGTMRSGNNGASNPSGMTLSRDGAAMPTIGSWGSPFPQGGLMGMGDATVRFFPYINLPNAFGAYLTPTGGEEVTLPDS